MNKKEAIAHCAELCEHLKGMDSGSRDGKAIHALLTYVGILEQIILDGVAEGVMSGKVIREKTGIDLNGEQHEQA